MHLTLFLAEIQIEPVGLHSLIFGLDEAEHLKISTLEMPCEAINREPVFGAQLIKSAAADFEPGGTAGERRFDRPVQIFLD